jgi:iron complex outermembrane receptor protein
MNELLRAFRVGVLGLLLLGFSAALAQDESSEESEDAQELQRMSVTGTRIKRVDAEGALPVTIIDREMIELSGETSLQDLLRNLTFNSFGSYTSQFQGDMGTSQVDLRGLGSGRTLILVDGRRLPKAPVATASQSVNTIPMGAVERIEVLSDGASAIYGSDAIGGVINIITRKDYSGWELMYGRAQPQYGEGERDEGTIMWGKGFDQSNLLVNFSWNNRDISYDRDFKDPEQGESLISNNFIPIDPETGQPSVSWWTAFPGGCQDTDAFKLVPDPSSLSGEICVYDYAAVAAAETSEDTQGLLVKFAHEINTNWQLWTDVYATRVEAFGRFAPAPYSSFYDNFPIPADSPNNPTNPESPMYDPVFGPNVPVHWNHRFESMGFRDFTREASMIDVQAGVNAWLGGIEFELGLRKTWNWTDSEFLNWLNDSQIYQVINDGSYNMQAPASTPEEILDRLRLHFYDDFRFDQEELFTTLSWDLFETPAGPVQWVLGGELRREQYRFQGSAVTFDDVIPYEDEAAQRDTTSLFFETLVPLTSDFELSLAGRYDDYSDWGSEFSPKISARWRVHDTLVTRASWGEGFRAPRLSINAIEGFSFPAYGRDPQSCAATGRPEGCLTIYQSTFTVSPELGAETSDQSSFGLVWEPADWFSQTIDYYDIRLENAIGQYGPGQVWGLDQAGLPLPAGLAVIRAPNGLLQEIIHGWANYGFVETTGLDLNAKIHFDLGPGRWRSQLMYSHIFDYGFENLGEPSGNIVGTPTYPEARATLSNYYDIRDFTFAWNLHYTAEQRDLDSEILFYDKEVPTWVTHDVQVNYHTPWNGRFTLGVQNVTGKEAPDAGYFSFWLYDFYGRVFYADYTQTFQ